MMFEQLTESEESNRIDNLPPHLFFHKEHLSENVTKIYDSSFPEFTNCFALRRRALDTSNIIKTGGRKQCFN